MDKIESVIAELRAVTGEMAAQADLGGEEFAKLLQRRGELIRELCASAFDPRDYRLGSIVRDGDAVLARTRSRRNTLREEAANLRRLASLVGGMKSTLFQPERSGVDINA